MNEIQDPWTRSTPARHYSARELREIPREERRRILAELAPLAEALYRAHLETSDLGDAGLEILDHDADSTPR